MMYLQVLRTKYDQFGGRAGRREFWLFWLVHFVLSVIAGVVDDRVLAQDSEWFQFGPLFSIYWLITIVPVLALGARRLHDTGRSGWYQVVFAFWFPTVLFAVFAIVLELMGVDIGAGFFLALAFVFFMVALVGTLILFIFAVLPGDESDNQYGNPAESPNRPPVYWTVLTTRYAMFAGRAGRKEFWLYTLVGQVVLWAARALDQSFLTGAFPGDGGGLIGVLIIIATIVPALALGARRLHDIGRTGWWQLLLIPPITPIGLILLIIWAIMPSQEGENKHGEPAIAPE